MAARPRMLSRRLAAGALLLGLAGCMQRMPVDAPPASVVFFPSFSADLDADALQVVDHVVTDARANPRRSIIVQGFADRTIATAMASKTLSELRAQVVADSLVSHGIDRSRIVLRPRGATTADPGIESRRVDISFGS